eukprot:m.107579 g.107579  ORF g.107579 m.107579 type:complete len:441 (+) comp8985_c0_seq1:78-1400(+)
MLIASLLRASQRSLRSARQSPARLLSALGESSSAAGSAAPPVAAAAAAAARPATARPQSVATPLVPRPTKLMQLAGVACVGAGLLAGLFYLDDNATRIVNAFSATTRPQLATNVRRRQLTTQIQALVQPTLQQKDPKGEVHFYGVIAGLAGSGKTTAVREALTEYSFSSRGVFYFHAPAAPEELMPQLALAVSPVQDHLDIIGRLKQLLVHHKTEAPAAAWARLQKELASAADQYYGEHGYAPTLVLDGVDGVAARDPAMFASLQDFATMEAVRGGLRVVFVVSTDGAAMPLIRAAQSSSSRALFVEVDDLSDADARSYLYSKGVGYQLADKAVKDVTGGRLHLLAQYQRSLELSRKDNFGDALDNNAAAALKAAGMEATHPFLKALATKGSMQRAAAYNTGLTEEQLSALIAAKVVAVSVSGALSPYSRAVQTHILAST